MMRPIIQNIKVNMMLTLFFIVAGGWVIWQWVKAYWYVDFNTEFDTTPRPKPSPQYKKPTSDIYDVDYFKRLAMIKEAKKLKEKQMKELECWELLLENKNHLEIGPRLILKTSSYDLASYVMDNMYEAYKDFGYSKNTFTLYIRSHKGGIITRVGTHVS